METARRFKLAEALKETRGGVIVRLRADEGATRQQGVKMMFTCECGAHVVWLKSKRTGRNYLAECYQYANMNDSPYESGWYYMGRSPHTWDNHDRYVEDANRAMERAMERVYDR